MRLVQVLCFLAGACHAFDQARFQRTTDTRNGSDQLPIGRELFGGKEDVDKTSQNRGHDDDPIEHNRGHDVDPIVHNRGHDGDPIVRNVFLSRATPSPTVAPVAPVTRAPTTAAPVTPAPISTTGAPATAAPISTTVAPVTAAPVVATPAPVTLAPVTSPPVDGGGPTAVPLPPTVNNRAAVLSFLTTLTDESELIEEGVAQNAAFESLLVTHPTLDPANEADQPVITQIYALNVVFFAMSFNNGFPSREGWVTEAPYCSDGGNWFGVTCAADDVTQVSELVLNGNSLSGFIPSEIRGLSSLRRLELSNSQSGQTFLTGEIPSTIGEMTLLEVINFANNLLGFTFPPDADPLPVANAIPTEMANLANLNTLILGNNLINEKLSFDTFVPMSSLQTLNLSVNIFNGVIPTTVGQLPASLALLNLDGNRLAGPIPTEIGSLVNLRTLRLSRSDPAEEPDGSCSDINGQCINGAIPSEIGNLVNLEELWLFENALDNNIPTEIGNLVSLKRLLLFSNELSGDVPTEIGGLVNLQTLVLSTNVLGSSITQEIFQLPALVILHLHKNVFNNTRIPETYNLPNIQILRLDDNFFTGSVPSALSQLQTLRKSRTALVDRISKMSRPRPNLLLTRVSQ